MTRAAGTTGARVGHIPTLDGARGVAALLVVVSHAANAGMLPAVLGAGTGQLGVLVFFVLSGFLMGYLYAGERPSASRVRSYWARRTARVVPLYFTVVTVSLAFASTVGVRFYPFGPETALRHVLFIEGAGVLWTIPVEVHFYVIFSILWVVGVVRRPLAVAAAVAVGVGLAVVLDPTVHQVPGAAILLWVWSFLVGTLLGIAHRRSPLRAAALGDRFGWVGWIGALGLVFLLPGVRRLLEVPVVETWRDPLAGLFAIGFFCLALTAAGPFAALGRRPARWLGRVSYSVYLLHMPVIILVLRAGDQLTWLGPSTSFVAVLVGTLALSAVSHERLEVPAGRWLNRRLDPLLRRNDRIAA